MTRKKITLGVRRAVEGQFICVAVRQADVSRKVHRTEAEAMKEAQRLADLKKFPRVIVARVVGAAEPSSDGRAE